MHTVNIIQLYIEHTINKVEVWSNWQRREVYRVTAVKVEIGSAGGVQHS